MPIVDLIENVKTEEWNSRRVFQRAMNFAKTYISKRGKIECLQRTDEYEVPIVAIREALINAVVHMDYNI